MIPLSGLKWLDKKNVDQSAINMIKAVGHVGCDGTAVNTGIRGGIIRLLEVALNRPLQWFVYQFHANLNELPLKHLDGPTTGPRGFSSLIMPIGKSLANCEKLPIVDFEPLNCVLPPSINSDDLSTDQKYLFDMLQRHQHHTVPKVATDSLEHAWNQDRKSRNLTLIGQHRL